MRVSVWVAAALALFLLALVPRVLTLDQHATADEDLTLTRSANVALALERRDWWETYQIGHPEATVQLLVAMGLGPDRLRPYAGEFLGPDSRTSARVRGYFETLVAARALLSPVHRRPDRAGGRPLLATLGAHHWCAGRAAAGIGAVPGGARSHPPHRCPPQ